MLDDTRRAFVEFEVLRGDGAVYLVMQTQDTPPRRVVFWNVVGGRARIADDAHYLAVYPALQHVRAGARLRISFDARRSAASVCMDGEAPVALPARGASSVEGVHFGIYILNSSTAVRVVSTSVGCSAAVRGGHALPLAEFAPQYSVACERNASESEPALPCGEAAAPQPSPPAELACTRGEGVWRDCCALFQRISAGEHPDAASATWHAAIGIYTPQLLLGVNGLRATRCGAHDWTEGAVVEWANGASPPFAAIVHINYARPSLGAIYEISQRGEFAWCGMLRGVVGRRYWFQRLVYRRGVGDSHPVYYLADPSCRLVDVDEADTRATRAALLTPAGAVIPTPLEPHLRMVGTINDRDVATEFQQSDVLALGVWQLLRDNPALSPCWHNSLATVEIARAMRISGNPSLWWETPGVDRCTHGECGDRPAVILVPLPQ